MKNKSLVLLFIAILAISIVSAIDYTPTGDQDFNVYIDPQMELSGKVYATVSIDQAEYPGDAKCVDMIFYTNGTRYMHIQSNPTLASSGGVNLRVGAVSPEEKGYFDIKDGIGTIYFRDKDVIPYNNFTLVVLCNVGNQSLVYEENVNPVWRAAFKSLPSRGVWFAESDNADMIVLVGVSLFLIVLFVFYKMVKR
jgi:hypothetical protein